MKHYAEPKRTVSAGALEDFLAERELAPALLRTLLLGEVQDPDTASDGTSRRLVPLWRWAALGLDAAGATDPATVPREQ